MCGIVGAINTGLGQTAAAGFVRKLSHRGPDDSGIYTYENLWLGHTRLAIQDLTTQGHQPMQDETGNYVIVFNGEIYNHWELRQQLEKAGFHFHSTSDTETLLKAYIHWGPACLDKLNGIFAFAVLERQRDMLFVARDHFGVKPLYFYQKDDRFAFASEIKAIKDLPGSDRSLDATVFYSYLLLLWAPGEFTPYQHIKKLLPGHYMRIPLRDPQRAEIKQYYMLHFDGRYDDRLTEAEWTDRLDECLTNAVKRQLLSDVPVGYFLSGGLDSSLLLAIARKLQPDALLKAFTIDTRGDFRGEGFAEDLPYAQKVAAHLDADLQIIPAHVSITADFDAMIYNLDEPQADAAPLFVGAIAHAAQQQGIKVLLGGTGADDIFSGYKRHQALALEKHTGALPPLVRKGVKIMGNLLPHNNAGRRIRKLTQYFDQPELQRRMSYYYWQAPERVQQLFVPELRKHLHPREPYFFFGHMLEKIPEEQSPLNQMLFWDIYSFLQHNLNYTDKMAMGAGVEVRVPYLDRELMELAVHMPPELKMKGRQTKYILRKLAERYLPQEVIYRPKTGFGAPVRSWVKNEMQPMIQQRLFSEAFTAANIFEPGAIRRLIADNAANKTDGAYTIWALLAAESWIRQFG